MSHTLKRNACFDYDFSMSTRRIQEGCMILAHVDLFLQEPAVCFLWSSSWWCPFVFWPSEPFVKAKPQGTRWKFAFAAFTSLDTLRGEGKEVVISSHFKSFVFINANWTVWEGRLCCSQSQLKNFNRNKKASAPARQTSKMHGGWTWRNSKALSFAKGFVWTHVASRRPDPLPWTPWRSDVVIQICLSICRNPSSQPGRASTCRRC